MEEDKDDVERMMCSSTVDFIDWGGIRVDRVPVERDEGGYNIAFPVYGQEAEAKKFFDKFGFVVFSDVLSANECTNTINEVFSLVEGGNSGFDRNDSRTWSRWPHYGMKKHGMPTRLPVFTEAALSNRQNPNIHHAFATILGTPQLLVSHDRYGLIRPTKNVNIGGRLMDMHSWRSDGGLHLDVDPWGFINDDNKVQETLGGLRYGLKHLNHFIFENNQIHKSMNGGLHVQGVLNLLDNLEDDGGFYCVPGFRHLFNEWVEKNKDTEWVKLAADRNSLPFDVTEDIYKLAVRISMRPGSLVIWDQMTPHGRAPNYSDRMRIAQFIKMFPAHDLPLQPERQAARAATVREMLQKCNFGVSLTDLGRKLFGLDEWEDKNK